VARKRMLSPEFFTSGPVSELPLSAMITFAGLWCYVDDYGRGEDNADLVKAAVWPRRTSHTKKHVASDLDAIFGMHLICRYESSGVHLMHIPSWSEHQKISHRTDSKLPPCPGHEAALYSFFLSESGGALDKFRNGSGTAPDWFAKSSGGVRE
jgi:hypothetical protein